MFPLAGELKDMAVAWLFQELRKERKTGTAIFEQGAAIMKVFFKGGVVIFASSNIDNDTMGEFLVRTGKITRDQLDESAKIIMNTGKKLGAVLFERGALTPQELVAQVKFQAQQNILNLFSWQQGRYCFEDGLVSSAEIVPLQMSTENLVLAGVRDLDWPLIRKSLPPIDTRILRISDPTFLLQSSYLDENERKVWALIDGNHTIEEICRLSDIGDFNTLKSLYLLLALRMAEKAEVKSRQEKQTDHEITPEGTVANEKKEPDPTSAETKVTREVLQNAYDSLDIQDYYEILGVGRRATPQEIKTAYFSLVKLYHPDHHADPRFADMKQKIETLFENINEAYNILSVREKRDQYNMDLGSGIRKYEKKEPTPVYEQENKTASRVSAMAHFKEGMKQFRVQNFWGAEEAFGWAVHFEPSNAEYIYYQGVALAHMPRRRHEAEEYFLKAVSLAPSKIEYYLELGNFYVKNGLKAKALIVYHDALKHHPNADKIKQAIKNAG
jgi:tetratricopeptide (TPR) repeat protein